MSNNLTLHDVLPAIKSVVESGNEASFIPEGISMRPMLSGGRDEIVLKRARFPLKKYELPLYVRSNGTIVLHRVVKVYRRKDGKNAYLFRGDNTFVTEHGIEDSNIIAVVTRFCRNGKWHNTCDLSYKIYAAVWTEIYPIRLFLKRSRNVLGGFLRKLHLR